MINPQLPTIFLIVGMVFLFISVIGQAQLGFASINPGCFGRFLALIFGLTSLILAVSLSNFSTEMLDAVRIYITNQIQQNTSLFNG